MTGARPLNRQAALGLPLLLLLGVINTAGAAPTQFRVEEGRIHVVRTTEAGEETVPVPVPGPILDWVKVRNSIYLALGPAGCLVLTDPGGQGPVDLRIRPTKAVSAARFQAQFSAAAAPDEHFQ